MNAVSLLLDRLEGVKQTGPGTWSARCPAHGSKGRTLAIREAEDGKVLIRCFAECDVTEVVGAVGLELSDLFPPRPKTDFVRGTRRPFPAADILRCIAEEVMVVWVISRDLELMRPVKQDDFDRLTVANRRIQSALELINER
jgi:hypothetical protein